MTRVGPRTPLPARYILFMVLHDALPLIPFPSSVRLGEGSVPLGSVRLTGDPDAVGLLRPELEGLLGADALDDAGATRVVLEIDPAQGSAEGYALDAGAEGIRVTGHDAAGLFYGTRTLLQLMRRGEHSGSGSDAADWSVPAVRIEDAPRFRYRGVMLDVARHFFGVADVERWIDRAVALKCNHLHLHLTDDQGWRLALDSRPELAAKASSSSVGGDPGGCYTRADWAEIVAHAASRQVTVVPEIDVPGHTHAVGLADPQLAADPVISDLVRETAEQFGGGLPAAGRPYTGLAVGFSSLKHDDPAVDAFLQDVFAEVAALTPGPYVHVGGDECLGTDPADYAAFVAKVTALVAATGKTPIAWHEAGAVAGIHPATVGQYWGYVRPQPGQDAAARAFAGRGGIILSPADAIYLDMKFDADSPLGLLWANGVTTLQDAYDWEPSAVLDGVDERQILGIEAPLWGETTRDLADIEQLAFPRIAAAAEIAWSDAASRDWPSFEARVGGLIPRWRAAGIRVP